MSPKGPGAEYGSHGHGDRGRSCSFATAYGNRHIDCPAARQHGNDVAGCRNGVPSGWGMPGSEKRCGSAHRAHYPRLSVSRCAPNGNPNTPRPSRTCGSGGRSRTRILHPFAGRLRDINPGAGNPVDSCRGIHRPAVSPPTVGFAGSDKPHTGPPVRP